jgi:hypothetical protein
VAGGPRCRRPLAPSPARHEDLGDACTSGPEHLLIDAVSPPADAQLSDSDVDRVPQLTGQIGGGQASRPAREDHDRYQAPAPERQDEDNEGESGNARAGRHDEAERRGEQEAHDPDEEPRKLGRRGGRPFLTDQRGQGVARGSGRRWRARNTEAVSTRPCDTWVDPTVLSLAVRVAALESRTKGASDKTDLGTRPFVTVTMTSTEGQRPGGIHRVAWLAGLNSLPP